MTSVLNDISTTGNGWMMLGLGTVFAGLGRYLIDHLCSLIFFSLLVDQDKNDSVETIITDKLYKHIIDNQSKLQGWKVRISKKEFDNTICEEVKNHQFTLPEGGILFWVGWHIFYAYYNPGNGGYWSCSHLSIYGFRWSRKTLINLVDRSSFSEQKSIKYQWTYGKDDSQLWKPGKGRNKFVQKPIYIPTPDADRVLEEVDRCVKAWDEKSHPMADQCNKGCFLLWGPPGTFKTSLVKYITCARGSDLYVINPSDLRGNFHQMMETLPVDSVVIFDDIDMDIFNPDKNIDFDIDPRNRRRMRENMDIKATLKTVMDGTVNLPERCLFFICCNNTEFDPAIASRFTPFYMGYGPRSWKELLFDTFFPNQKLGSKFADLYEGKEISQREITRTLTRCCSSDPEKTIQTIKDFLKSSDNSETEEIEEPEEEIFFWK